ncbi:MAG: TetR/AcrR family transcriptional regulator [Candidatus Acidiferrales bacterium]
MLTNKTRVRDGRGRPRKSTLNARKAPGQARSKETVSVILEASARILEAEGMRGFNTNAIAARAGVSVGSLYQYFPNKDAIVRALISRFEETLHDAVRRAVQGGRGRALKPRLRLLVRALVTAHYARPRLNRMLEAEEERVGSAADSGAFHESVLQLLREHQKVMAVRVSRTTEGVVMAILRALVDLGLASGASARSTEQRAMRAICGYLLFAD